MKPELRAGAAAAGLLALLAVGALRAQQQPSSHPHEQEQARPAVSSAPAQPDIFCPTMKTGQLCSHGTADALKVEAVKKELWIQVVRRYNKTVDEATLQLQQEAKTMLTAEQLAEVERWFAKGLNPQINQLLQAPAKGSR